MKIIVMLMILAIPLSGTTTAVQASAKSVDNTAFRKVWERTDSLVAAGKVPRSWVWGPKMLEGGQESFDGAPSGLRLFQYYDKARMEINDPAGDPASPWYVTSGLLVVEMMSGRMQNGVDRFVQGTPSGAPVAGEATGPNGERSTAPSYATISRVASLSGGENRSAPRTGQPVVDRLNAVAEAPALPRMPSAPTQAPRIAYYEPATGHNIPDVFWAFLNQRGTVSADGRNSEDRLFDWVYVSGYPVTEPYWIEALVAGKPTSVMAQAFQRRILTYNPANSPEWRVEMGNVGLAHYNWRAGEMAQPRPVEPVPITTPGKGDQQMLQLRQLGTQSVRTPGVYSGVGETLYAAINSQAAWAALWRSHTATRTPNDAPPAVDFAKEFVVAAFWGDKSNGCYSLKIESIGVSGSSVTVTVTQSSPKMDQLCTDAITQPHDIVAVQKVGLTSARYEVIFKDQRGEILAREAITLP